MPTWFPTVSLHGYECLLLLPEINWRQKPRVIHSLAGSGAEGRTGIAARAADHPEVRVSVDYLYTLPNAQAEEFCSKIETFLESDPEARFLIPLWLDKLPAAEYAASSKRKWTTQHTLNFDPQTAAYAIDADGGYPFTVGLAMVSPLELPARSPVNNRDCNVRLKAEEDSPWEARVDVHELAQEIWDFETDWTTAPEDKSRWLLQRKKIGPGRLQARSGQNAAIKHDQSATFVFRSDEEIRRALTFWKNHAGSRDAFTVPLYFRPGWEGDPETIPQMQAHFADETFNLEFSLPGAARSRLGFDQDLLLVEGQPSQSRPSMAFLFKVWWEGSSTLMTWTDWPVAYVHDGITYQPRVIELKSAVETLRAGDTQWELLVNDFEGNPLRAWGRLAIERRLMIEIRQCNPAIANTAALVFSGRVKKPTNKGSLYTVPLVVFGGALKFLVPSCTCQTGCNNTLGDDLCGKDIETLKATGAIAALAAETIDVTTADVGAADAWALGYALFGAGDDVEVRYILKSAPIGGGQRLVLNRPLWSSAVAAAVVMYPGCDQQYEGGCARWGNQGRFFGAPYKPDFIESVDSGYRAKTGK